MKKYISIVSAFVLAGSLNAQWEVIDDFEDGDLAGWSEVQEVDNASVLPTNTVVDDPFDLGQGKVLEITHGVQAVGSTSALNQTVRMAIPEALRIVTDLTDQTKVSTFYFKVGRPVVGGSPAEVDTVFSLQSTENEDNGVLYYSSGSVIARYEKDGGIDFYDDTTYTPTKIANGNGPANDTNTYYELWFVVNHSTLANPGAKGEYDLYIKGGTDFPTQTLLATGALYRSAAVKPLDTIVIITSTGNEADKGKDPIYFDDFYVDNSGLNLTSPNGSSNDGLNVKFVNVATRGLVGANAGEELIAGFVVLGENPQKVLIRGLGPDLTDRGVSGVLADPMITVRNFAQQIVATNDDWGNAANNADVVAAIAQASNSADAELVDDSADAAIVVTLAPNDVYTVVVESATAGGSGVALAEVFELDNQ